MSLFVRLKEGQVGIIERSGKYLKTVFAGNISILVPAIDKLFIYDLRPKIFDLPKFSVLIKKSFTLDIDVVLKYKIMEPWKARYETEKNDLEYSIEKLIIKVTSNFLSDMQLDKAIDSQNDLKILLDKQLVNISKNWGFKLIHIEIKSITKSFLAEQEKEKLYDIHKNERGSFISEKVDLRDPSKSKRFDDELPATQEEDNSATIIKDASHDVQSIDTELSLEENNVESLFEQIKAQEITNISNIDQKIKQLSEKENQPADINLVKQQQELDSKMKQVEEMHKEILLKQQELMQLQQEITKKKNSSENPPED